MSIIIRYQNQIFGSLKRTVRVAVISTITLQTVFVLKKNNAIGGAFEEHFNTKGQLISKCLFGAIISTQKPTKFF